jgi:hypothetical protein
MDWCASIGPAAVNMPIPAISRNLIFIVIPPDDLYLAIPKLVAAVKAAVSVPRTGRILLT